MLRVGLLKLNKDSRKTSFFLQESITAFQFPTTCTLKVSNTPKAVKSVLCILER